MFLASYLLLGVLLVAESIVMAYVMRGTVRAALNHHIQRSTPAGLRPKVSDRTGVSVAPGSVSSQIVDGYASSAAEQ
jgi:hypothetical protein